jgi:hypothetical protein
MHDGEHRTVLSLSEQAKRSECPTHALVAPRVDLGRQVSDEGVYDDELGFALLNEPLEGVDIVGEAQAILEVIAPKANVMYVLEHGTGRFETRANRRLWRVLSRSHERHAAIAGEMRRDSVRHEGLAESGVAHEKSDGAPGNSSRPEPVDDFALDLRIRDADRSNAMFLLGAYRLRASVVCRAPLRPLSVVPYVLQ